MLPLLSLPVLLTAFTLEQASAQDVLLPEFTPSEFSDLEVSSSLYERTLERFAQAGISAFDASTIRVSAGNDADMCADETSCPGTLWPFFPKARLALVGRVGRGDGTILLRTEFYIPTSFVPIETAEQVMVESGYESMAQALAETTQRVLDGIKAAEAEAAALAAGPPDRGRKKKKESSEPTTSGGRDIDAEAAELAPGGLLARFTKRSPDPSQVEPDPVAEKKAAKAEKPKEKASPPKESTREKIAAAKARALSSDPSDEPSSTAPPKPKKPSSAVVVTSSTSPPRYSGKQANKGPIKAGIEFRWWNPASWYGSFMSGRHPLYTENRARRERRSMRIPWSQYERFRETEQKRSKWVEDHHLTEDFFFVQAGLGFIHGDINRAYHVRTAYEATQIEPLGVWQEDRFVAGNGGLLAATAGFGATWWSSIDLRVGIQTGKKALSTGWETWQGGRPADLDVADYPSAFALRAFLEPRLRITPLAQGRYRPYALALYSARFYDAYILPAPEQGPGYPGRAGGVSHDLGGGAGMEYLLRRDLYVQGEITGSRRLSPAGTYSVDSPFISHKPTTDPVSGGSVSAVFGAGWRF